MWSIADMVSRMAKQVVTTTTYTDDIDGGPAIGTVTFGFEGTDYEIDLSRANTKAFEKVIALYVGHGRKVRNTRRRGAVSSTGRRDLPQVRAWAHDNGYAVSDRGRVSAAILEAFDAAH
jgi:hypothetical protein